MARADLLIDIVKAGAEGDQTLFQKALEALITEERAKQHNILADRLAEHLNLNGKPMRPTRPTYERPSRRRSTAVRLTSRLSVAR